MKLRTLSFAPASEVPITKLNGNTKEQNCEPSQDDGEQGELLPLGTRIVLIN